MSVHSPIGRHLGSLLSFLGNRLMYTDEDKVKCDKCKGKMILHTKKLYLLPCFFGDEHDESATYYSNNAQALADLNQIPTGQRAAYASLFICEECFNKKISIIDFLKVRDTTHVKGGGMYSYEELRDLI